MEVVEHWPAVVVADHIFQVLPGQGESEKVILYVAVGVFVRSGDVVQHKSRSALHSPHRQPLGPYAVSESLCRFKLIERGKLLLASRYAHLDRSTLMSNPMSKAPTTNLLATTYTEKMSYRRWCTTSSPALS